MVIIPIDMPESCAKCCLTFKKLGCLVGGTYTYGEERPSDCPCVEVDDDYENKQKKYL